MHIDLPCGQYHTLSVAIADTLDAVAGSCNLSTIWISTVNTQQAFCAGLEILLFLIPISIVLYLPSFFFGALLMLFGIEISLSWLVLSYKKASLSPSLTHTCCDALVLLLVA